MHSGGCILKTASLSLHPVKHFRLTSFFYFQIKCHQYFPVGQDNEGEDEMAFNDVGLKVTFITETESNYHYTARVFEIQDMEVRVEIHCSVFQ